MNDKLIIRFVYLSGFVVFYELVAGGDFHGSVVTRNVPPAHALNRKIVIEETS